MYPMIKQLIKLMKFIHLIFDIFLLCLSYCLRCFSFSLSFSNGLNPLDRVPTDQGNFWRLFSSQGNQGKTAKLRGKILKSGNFFRNHFQPFKPFNLRKKCFKWGGFTFGKYICNKHYPNGKWRPHLKRMNMVLLTKMSW